MELAYVVQAVFEFIEICLPLPPKYLDFFFCVCVYMYVPHVFVYPQRPEESSGSSREQLKTGI